MRLRFELCDDYASTIKNDYHSISNIDNSVYTPTVHTNTITELI